MALALVGYVFLVALTYGFTHVFSGRGAFTQIGALIGTIMVANVFVIIIPYQKKTVAAMLAGKEPDPRWGALGKPRSVHNNYLTLPVVFLMLSNHYPLFFATKYNWLIVAIVLLIGPVIRHFFNSRHDDKGSPWWTWAVAAAGMAAVAWLSAAGPRATDDRRAAAAAQIRQRRRHRLVALQHVPCGRTGVGRHRRGARRRPARQRRTDPAACAADRHRRGALERHAAGQHHRNDQRRAPGAGVLARLRRAGEVRRPINQRWRGDARDSRPALSFVRAPRGAGDAESYRYIDDGIVVVEGRPDRAGRAGRRTRRALPAGTPVAHHADALIMPGFIDPHIHFPQTQVIASYGAQLLEWLEKYTFVEEQKFADPAHAARNAEFFLDELARNGTTTALAYCTAHPGSADALVCRGA